MTYDFSRDRAFGLFGDTCFDCGMGCCSGDMQAVDRAGKPELVCLECAIESGDDNYHSCQEHEKERL